MIVNEEKHTIDFSENPTRELDGEILSKLRDALEFNDHYCKLVFNNNRLTHDAVGILAAIIKGSTPIEFLSLRSCKFRDGDLLQIINALCTRKVLRYIDLSKNPSITGASAPHIAKMIQAIPTLHTILLSGTNLIPINCNDIITAVEQSVSIKLLDLPYTVGFKVLDTIRKIIKKKTENENNVDKEKKREGSPSSPLPPSSLPSTHIILETVTEDTCNSFNSKYLPKLVPPPRLINSANLRTINTPPPINSLQNMEFKHWADPAVKTAAVHLHVLDKRCHLLEVHKQEKRERNLARRGRGLRSHSSGWNSLY